MLPDVHSQTRYEKIILAENSLPRELASVLAGASRASRLARCSTTSHERIVAEVSAGFLAPLVFFYAAWVLRQARSKGITRLYFLARDAYLVMKAAEVLSERWGIDIELRYLYSSREAWLLPSLVEIDEFACSWITWGYLSSISLDEIERRLQLPSGALCHRLEATPEFANTGPSTSLTGQQLEIVKALLVSRDAYDEIRRRSDTLLENVSGYLAGQGVFDGTSYALVDTGWKATSQYGFQLILDKLGINSGVTAYYLGLNRKYHLHTGDSACSFLFDWNRTGIDYRLYNFLCFELLLSAKDGRTIGYGDSSKDYAPILLDNPAPENMWAIDIHHDCVASYLDYVSRVLSPDDLIDDGARLCRRLASEFISRPGRDEASVYGNLRIAGEMSERDLQCLAPSMDYRELFRIALKKSKIRGFWPQGSMARSGMHGALSLYGLFLDSRLLDWYRRTILKY